MHGKLEKCGLHLISIHVPRVEDDYVDVAFGVTLAEFQSTSPVWRTTCYNIVI